MKQADLVIIGGGIIGLAAAYSILKEDREINLILLEKEADIAQHQTGHNSGVIHSGIYYKPGSLKAKNSVLGVQKLLEFCKLHNIPYDLCGKLIVATDESELPRLEELFKRGQANGVGDLKLLEKNEIRKIEPYANGIKALYSPNTGIIDYSLVAKKLLLEIQDRGAQVFLKHKVERIEKRESEIVLMASNQEFVTKNLINCCGLYSDEIARKTGIDFKEKIIPFRGEYYFLNPDKSNLLKGLIYPVPNPKFPFLGVHLTRRLSGQVEVGPNAVLAFAKEGYKKRDIKLKEVRDYLNYSGFWSMALRYWKVGFYEFYRSYSKKMFLKDVQRLMPEIQEKDLFPGGSGVRAQVVSPNGQMVDDFLIKEAPQILNVLNAPSPGATSCLAIGEYLKSALFKAEEV
jgi:L-2-hydroxyglutarate oxidase